MAGNLQVRGETESLCNLSVKLSNPPQNCHLLLIELQITDKNSKL
jgi:hypothetical protein